MGMAGDKSLCFIRRQQDRGGSSAWGGLGLRFDTGQPPRQQQQEAGGLAPSLEQSRAAAVALVILTSLSGTARNQDAAA